MVETILLLSSGLFLGWSLGANDAANVFGTAVGTRMIRFRTAAAVCSVFVVLGATVSGAGAAHTLGRLGAVNALPGAFTVALASALSTFWMTRLRIPVSTSQSIVGAILGWNFYTASVTDGAALARIVSTWVVCPLLSGVIAVALYVLTRRLIHLFRPHLLRLDHMTRVGLLLVGAFGSYSLGANNIANVMGVFVADNPFRDTSVFGLFTQTGVQLLFLLGGLAIAAGVITYSERVMRTVGTGLARISPISALVVVLAQSLTLFLFASERLEHLLAGWGLPTIPLVPVSSSQAVVGAIVGISLFKRAGLRYRTLGGISLGWLATPLLACVASFFLLFFVDNVFDQEVVRPLRFRIDAEVVAEAGRLGLPAERIAGFVGTERVNALRMRRDLRRNAGLAAADADRIIRLAEVGRWRVDAGRIAAEVDRHWLTPEQMAGLRSLTGSSFDHAWQLRRALAASSPAWRPGPDVKSEKLRNKELEKKLSYLERVFRSDEPAAAESDALSGGEATQPEP